MVYKYLITDSDRPGWDMGLSPINRDMTSWDQEHQLEAMFYPWSCRLPNGTRGDCTSFCSQPDLIWGTQSNSDAGTVLHNLVNCFSLLKAYYILELAAADPTIRIGCSYQTADEGAFQYVSTEEIMGRLGLVKASDANLTLFSSSLGTCLTAYCQSGAPCAPQMWTTIHASDTSIVRVAHQRHVPHG